MQNKFKINASYKATEREREREKGGGFKYLALSSESGRRITLSSSLILKNKRPSVSVQTISQYKKV